MMRRFPAGLRERLGRATVGAPLPSRSIRPPDPSTIESLDTRAVPAPADAAFCLSARIPTEPPPGLLEISRNVVCHNDDSSRQRFGRLASPRYPTAPPDGSPLQHAPDGFPPRHAPHSPAGRNARTPVSARRPGASRPHDRPLPASARPFRAPRRPDRANLPGRRDRPNHPPTDPATLSPRPRPAKKSEARSPRASSVVVTVAVRRSRRRRARDSLLPRRRPPRRRAATAARPTPGSACRPRRRAPRA